MASLPSRYAAAVDLSGDYVVTVPIPCRVTVVQTGTAFQITGSRDFMGASVSYSASGAVKPATGDFSGSSNFGGACPGVFSGDREHGHLRCVTGGRRADTLAEWPQASSSSR